MGSNIIHLSDFAVPSYRRPRAAVARSADAGAATTIVDARDTWATMARQRAAQKWRATSDLHAVGASPSAASVAQGAGLVQGAVAPSAGALRLSGRLADVCAELERLAAVEAAQMAA